MDLMKFKFAGRKGVINSLTREDQYEETATELEH